MDTILLHPTYFPSIVQMVAIVQAKKVVFETEDNYQKQTYRNRARIAHSNGALLLNVPIKHAKNGVRQKYKDVVVENNFPWQSQHWKSLQSAYRTSPFFEYYEYDIAPLFTAPVSNLLTHNMFIFKTLCELLELELKLETTTAYHKNPQQLDLRYLAKAKKEPLYNLAPYTQVLQEADQFLSNLSILDLLFNEGTQALSYLQAQEITFTPKLP